MYTQPHVGDALMPREILLKIHWVDEGECFEQSTKKCFHNLM